MVVMETLQQLFNAASAIAPPHSNPVFFWGTLLLAFSIIYIAINKVPQFEDKKWAPAKMIIALIMAYFAASSAFTTVLLAKLFPNFAIVIVAILVFLILAGLLGFEVSKKWPALIIALAMWWLFVTSTSQFTDLGAVNVFQEWQLIDWILVGGIIIALIYFIPGAKETVGKIIKIE